MKTIKINNQKVKTKMKCRKKTSYTKELGAKEANELIPNGFFKKRVFSFGLCFSWFITIFCLLFGEAQNIIHTQLAVCSFLTGVAFVFALVFKGKINTAWFKYGNESDKNN